MSPSVDRKYGLSANRSSSTSGSPGANATRRTAALVVDVGTVDADKAVVDVTTDDEDGIGTDDDTTEDATDVDAAAVASRVEDVADPHAASTTSDSTYAREFTDRPYTS